MDSHGMQGAEGDSNPAMSSTFHLRRSRPRRRGVDPSRASRGFTLVELLVVVAMVGVLAALALVGYNKYVKSAQASEATSMMQSIRMAQEAYRAEALSYVVVSAALDGASLYPRVQSDLDEAKTDWTNDDHDDYLNWVALNARPEGPVRFSYAVVSGPPGGTLPTAEVATMAAPTWANAYSSTGGLPRDPWFVISAVADRDHDGVYSVLQTGSMTNEVFIKDDTE